MALGQQYESLQPGQSLGHVEVDITADDVRALTFANLGAELEDDVDLAAHVQPSLVLALSLRAIMELDVIPSGGVLVGHCLSLREPLAIDDAIAVDVVIDRAWSSRGRPFVTLRITFVRGSSTVSVDEMTAIWPMDDPVALQRLPKVAATKQSSGAISQKQVERYAAVSGDHNPLHLDDDFAAQGPFGELVVHGVIPAGLMLDNWAASHPELLATNPVRLGFLSPLRPGEPFVIHIDDQDGTSRVVTSADQRVIATLSVDKSVTA